MKLSAALFTALLALAVVSGGTACTGTITDGGGLFGPDDDFGEPKTPEEEEEELKICVGDGDAGGECEVTADCNAPLLCLQGVCIGPSDDAFTCDPIEGKNCQDSSAECINGFCLKLPGACMTLDDCPLGYGCAGGQCTPERDGATCNNPGPGPELDGTYKTDSVLKLRDGLPGVIDDILGAVGKFNDILNGNLDVDTGVGFVDRLIGGFVANLIRQYIPDYGVSIIMVLAQMDDILNDLRVEGTLELEGQACDANYRGRHTWDNVTFMLNGQVVRSPPGQIPGIDEVVPEEFSARYYCGELLISKHRINTPMGALIRFLLNTGVMAVSNFTDINDALQGLIDCNGFGRAVQQQVGSCFTVFVDPCAAVGPVVTSACNVVVQIALQKINEAIDKAIVKLNLIKLKGIVPVSSSGDFGEGIWYGSLVGGEFRGTLRIQN